MQGEKVARGRWIFNDHHHEKCAQNECEKWFCRLHRRVYWQCQDADYDPSLNILTAGGDCVTCLERSRMDRAYEDWVLRQHRAIV